ncbi:MAG: DUF885 domain-containing protein [Gammaproteobacteria bacterium]
MKTMTRVAAIAAAAVLAGACGTRPDPVTPDQNTAFEAHAVALVDRFLDRNPEWSIYAGRYDNAHRMTVPNAARRADDLAFAEAELAALDRFDPNALDAGNRTDYELIRNRIEASRWYQTEFRSHEWNPAQYNVAGPIGLLLNTDFAPLEQRLEAVSTRLSRVPDYYAAARDNIGTPTLEHTRLAVQQSQGALAILGEGTARRAAESQLTDDDKAAFAERLDAARAAVSEWIDWLRATEARLVADGNARPFRIGEALYEQKFAYDIQSGYSARELYERALVEKERLHTQMDAITVALWPKYFPSTDMPSDRLERIGALIDHLSARHVARDGYFDEINRQIPLLAAFVAEHDLLDQDPTKPLIVRETPLYMRGSGAGASVSAPGPFNPGADTFYNVTPLDRFSDEQAESYLREYNHWILQILNIHEAIPGHYTQLVHANRSPSIVKALFGNGAMVEGWAVYAERMMLEEGWGDQEPEMWLMYGKWNLRVVVNAILDYAVHVHGAGEQEILALLRREAFQERTEATEKWRRATLSQVQLTSYFAGYAEIYDFREALKREMGVDFVLRDFHNEFLSYGRAPVRVIRELMQE